MTEKKTTSDGKPPLFPSWNWWYILVLVHLAGLIILFYLIAIFFK
jgi:hypothetical protein